MKCFTLEYLMHFSTVKSHLEAFILCTLNYFDSFYRQGQFSTLLKDTLACRLEELPTFPQVKAHLHRAQNKQDNMERLAADWRIMNFTPSFPSACIYLWEHSNVLLCIWQPYSCLLWTVMGVTKMIVVLLCDTFYFLFRHVKTAFNITTMTFVQTIKERKKSSGFIVIPTMCS